MLLAVIDWTMVLDSLIYVSPAWITVYLSFKIRRSIRIPSGGQIGEMVERTHAQTAIGAAGVKVIADALTSGDPNEPPTQVGS